MVPPIAHFGFECDSIGDEVHGVEQGDAERRSYPSEVKKPTRPGR
jgi:hypothetical protein